MTFFISKQGDFTAISKRQFLKMIYSTEVQTGIHIISNDYQESFIINSCQNLKQSIVLIAYNMRSISIDPLSRFPQGGKAFFVAPSPMGEVPISIGREGGKLIS
jgi:hypothetical protein